MKEFETIFKYFTPLSKGISGSLDLKDDGAIIDLGGEQMMVLSSDACVEEVHFPKGTPPDIIARRCLRVNLSDLAAMGAVPLAYTHTLILPKNIDESWFEKYSEGLKIDQNIFKVHLIGGDTVSTSGPITVSITTVGRVKKGLGLKRSNALNGDRLYLTGPIGDAYLGLKILKGEFKDIHQKAKDYLVERYYLPTPRLEEADLIKSYTSAATDISDGLLGDLGHMCNCSNLLAFIDSSKIPLSKAAQAVLKSLPPKEQKALFDEMITAGDDYELILSISPDKCEDAEFSAQTHNFEIHPIGHMGFRNKDDDESPSKVVTVVNENGEKQKFKRVGYEHSW